MLFLKARLNRINKKLNSEGNQYIIRVMEREKARTPNIVRSPEIDLSSIKKTADKINIVAQGMQLTSPCLCKSILCYLLLNKKHGEIQLKIGVKGYPFEAHAWIEYKGEVINDSLENVQKYVVFDDMAVSFNSQNTY